MSDEPAMNTFQAIGCMTLFVLFGWLIFGVVKCTIEDDEPPIVKIARAQAMYEQDLNDARERYASALKGAQGKQRK